MQFVLVAVAIKPSSAIESLIQEYAKRFVFPFSLDIRLVKPVKRNPSLSAEKIKTLEAKLIADALPKQSYCIALDERGKTPTTVQFKETLLRIQGTHKTLSFVIGGADGLDTSVLKQSDDILALSHLTLPHELARLLLVEQLYRAVSLIQNHPYHRT